MIDEAMIATFQDKGAVHLPGVFAAYVDAARDAIEKNKDNPSFRERSYNTDGGAAFFQDFCVWDQFDGYRALVTQSPMAAIAAKLMGSKTARLFHDHILVKEPGNTNVTPWHQDAPYYLVEASQTVSFWVPLDPVPRERTIEYVAGSHAWGELFRPERFNGEALYEGDTSPSPPDIDAARDAHEILGWACEPGDAVAFHFKTLHGAPANASPIRRRVVSVRWVGDDAVFAKRLGTTSPPFPDLDYEDGAPFEGEQFPVLYTA